MISAHHVTKVIAGRPLLHDVTLHVARGESVRLAGSRTSGCSMLLRILGTLVAPTAGTVSIDGVDAVAQVSQARRHVVYVGQDTLAGSGLTVEEYLRVLASARGVRPGRDVISALGHAGTDLRADLDTLAAGARAAVAIAVALLVRPPVILLDHALLDVAEPARVALMRSIREVREDGTTLVVASDQDDELSMLCGRVVTLRDGRLHEPAPLPRVGETACL